MGVLHTSSYYAIANVNHELSEKTFSSSGSISNLKAKEQQFYNNFGANNYQEFREKILTLFKDNPDIEVLNRFLPEQLTNSLARFGTSTGSLQGQEITIKLNVNNLKTSSRKINSDFVSSLNKINGEEIKVVGLNGLQNVFAINCKFNSANIKSILNALLKDRKFVVGSSNMERADVIMKEFSDKEINIFEIYQGGEENLDNQQYKFTTPSVPNFPWGVKKEDINLAAKNPNSELYKELKRAASTIKDFIFNELGNGATPDLKKAMLLVWQNQGFYAKTNEPLEFFKGTTSTNFISAVQGSLGEFYSAVLFQYINIKLGGNYSKIARILGDTIKNNEKIKTDLQLFQKFGVQVKHFNTIQTNTKTSFLREISTTIHPADFDKYGVGTFSLSEFLANYYFNTTYQEAAQEEFNNIKTNLGQYIGELMNMAMNDSVLTDVVTFYFIGGRYFVPCSSILEAAEKIDLKNSIEITSAYKGQSDEVYSMPFLIGGKPRPLFVDYWKKVGGIWSPRGKNLSTYHKLISKDISIRTRFDYWEELENFSIF